MNYIGIDLGGTNIKAAVVTETGKIIDELSCPTHAESGAEAAINAIASLIEKLAGKYTVSGVGMGCPGMVDDQSGFVVYANNLHWVNVDVRTMLREKTGFSVRLVNDANAAALAEALVGCGKDADSLIVITLGTGVGGGVMLNGKLLTGYTGAASELGHMVIVPNGELCACGRRGCFEQYGSATALLRMTKQAIERNPNGKMSEIMKKYGELHGSIPFEAADVGEQSAIAVVEQYTDYLALGIANLINIFFPEKLALSGGVAKQGEKLLTPLREKVSHMTYGYPYRKRHTEIVLCSLGYSAGMIGAALFNAAE